MRSWQKILWPVVLLMLLAAPATAHIAQVPYNLPVPFSMYAYGATGALLASFVVVGYFARSAPLGRDDPGRDVALHPAAHFIGSRAVRLALQVFAVLALALSIATGFVGSPVMNANFNITFFWIVCLLGFTYPDRPDRRLVSADQPLAGPGRLAVRFLAQAVEPVALPELAGLLPGARLVHAADLARAVRPCLAAHPLLGPDRLHRVDGRGSLALRHGHLDALRRGLRRLLPPGREDGAGGRGHDPGDGQRCACGRPSPAAWKSGPITSASCSSSSSCCPRPRSTACTRRWPGWASSGARSIRCWPASSPPRASSSTWCW